MLLIVLLLEVLLFCGEAEAAATVFTSQPSDKSYARESFNFTLVWSYTVNGAVALAKFSNVTGGISVIIANKLSQGGNTNVAPAFQERFRADISESEARLTILTVQRSDKGTYRFDLTDSNFGSLSDDVEVDVQSLAKFTNVSSDQTVHEGSTLQLFCEASGLPAPNITWVLQGGSEVLHRAPSWDFVNINSTNAGTYQCKADNGVGNPPTHAVTVTVLFSPRISLQNKYYVGREKDVSLHCQVEGYPIPTITWTPCNPQENVCDKSRLNIFKVMSDAVYTCTVNNSLGTASESTDLVIGDKTINLTLTITSEKCTDGKYDESFWKKLQEPVNKLYTNQNGYIGSTLLKVRCGSLIVDLALKFTTIVTEQWVLSTLRSAITDGKLGELSIDASSIAGIPVIESTAMPPTGKTTPRSSDDINIAMIVGIVVGGIVFIIIVAVVVWCVRVHKKKKENMKHNKEVANKEETGGQVRLKQVQGGNPTAGHGNNGYENTGAASTAYSVPQTATGVKKDKKGKKRPEEPDKPVGVVYAQVDKSKKTTKPKEPELLYDEADRRTGPNNKRPGEIQYAVLDQGHSMPRDSTAPPRKPPRYDETQYAAVLV